MSPITTQVQDIHRGRPAAGVGVRLEQLDALGAWRVLGSGSTCLDGRVETLIAEGRIATGLYRLSFATGDYFDDVQTPSFYPRITVEFEVHDASGHYHVPILISPFGYTTYRGA